MLVAQLIIVTIIIWGSTDNGNDSSSSGSTDNGDSWSINGYNGDNGDDSSSDGSTHNGDNGDPHHLTGLQRIMPHQVVSLQRIIPHHLVGLGRVTIPEMLTVRRAIPTTIQWNRGFEGHGAGCAQPRARCRWSSAARVE